MYLQEAAPKQPGKNNIKDWTGLGTHAAVRRAYRQSWKRAAKLAAIHPLSEDGTG